MPPGADGGRIAGLEGLRGLASLCVLVFHAGMIATGVQQGHAYLAVDFFFLLSGFIMARSYEAEFARRLGPIRFLGMRYARLWPIMAVGGALGLPVLAGKLGLGTDFFVIALCNLLLVPVPFGNAVFPLNPPAWSILYELGGNALHALLLWRLPLRYLAALVAGLALAMTAIAGHHTVNVGASPQDLHWGAIRFLLPYGLGILIWRTWGNAPPIRPSPAFSFGSMPLLFVAVALTGARSWVFDLAFILLVCPLMLAGGLACRGNSRLARALGAISFPLYAVHLPVLELAGSVGAGMVAGVAASLLVATGVAFLTGGLRFLAVAGRLRPA